MVTVEVRSLLNEDVRSVNVEKCVGDVFRTWYELFVKKTNREPTLIDVFYAGYILANPNVRNMYRILMKEKKKNDFDKSSKKGGR